MRLPQLLAKEPLPEKVDFADVIANMPKDVKTLSDTQLDRIIVHRDLNVEAAGVHMSAAARRASDHLPIWARVSA